MPDFDTACFSEVAGVASSHSHLRFSEVVGTA